MKNGIDLYYHDCQRLSVYFQFVYKKKCILSSGLNLDNIALLLAAAAGFSFLTYITSFVFFIYLLLILAIKPCSVLFMKQPDPPSAHHLMQHSIFLKLYLIMYALLVVLTIECCINDYVTFKSNELQYYDTP